MSSNPINVKINNFDMMNGMNATFNINGKDFDIMISPDDINKYFTSNTNIPIAKIIPNDESDNEVKGTIADDGNKKRTGFMSSVFGKFKNVSKLHPEDENAIDNAAEKIFENNRQDGNEILTGLMSNILEKLNKEQLTPEDKNIIQEFMKTPKHFRHEGGGSNITWVDNNNNDNVNELINGSFEKSLLGINTSDIKVHQIPDYINNNNDDDDTAKMKKWKFSQFLINAAFIQKYHDENKDKDNFDTYQNNLKTWKSAEYANLKPDVDTSVSYIFSALSRVLCYDNGLDTIEKLSNIVNYTGDITQYKNRYEFQAKVVEEYDNLVASFDKSIIQQDTDRNNTLTKNEDVCPTENLLAIDLGPVNLNNQDNDGNNVNVDNNNADNDDNVDDDWWNKPDELQEHGKSTLPIQNIKTIIKDSDNKDLKKDFEFLYKQYGIIRKSLKTIDRGINTIRDELPGMKNIIETESRPGARDNNRLTNMKNDLKNRLNEEKGKINTEVDELNKVIKNLENHNNYKVIDRSIIDKIRNYKDTYTVALYQLYKKFTSIAKSNLSWSDSISNVFSRKKSGEESINNNNNNSNTGKLSGFMSAIGNVFKRAHVAAGDGPTGNGGKKNRTKRLKEPRNRSLKKGNH